MNDLSLPNGGLYICRLGRWRTPALQGLRLFVRATVARVAPMKSGLRTDPMRGIRPGHIA